MIQKNIEFSIILPCFNAAKHIARSIDSCIAQKIPKNQYELIFINDGSQDNSLEIVLKKQKELPHFEVINQKTNCGLGHSRNLGIRKARGTYLIFLDADDTLDALALLKLQQCMEPGVEVVFLNYMEHIQEKKIAHFHSKQLRDKNILLENPKQLEIGSPFYCYQKAFIENHKFYFEENIFHEDFHWIPRVLYPTKKHQLTNFIFYHYYSTPGSITHSHHFRRAKDLLFITETYGTIVKTNEDKTAHIYFQNFFFAGIKATLKLVDHFPYQHFIQIYQRLRKILSEAFYKKPPYTIDQIYLLVIHTLFAWHPTPFRLGVKLLLFSYDVYHIYRTRFKKTDFETPS